MIHLHPWAEGDLTMLGFAFLFGAIAWAIGIASLAIMFSKDFGGVPKLVLVPITAGMAVFHGLRSFEALANYLGGF